MKKKKLMKSRTDKKIDGVLGGIAQYFGIDSSILRIIFLVALFFGYGSPIFAYIVASIIMPTEPRQETYYYGYRQERERKSARKVEEDEWSDF